jgi:hypothetical protein
VDDDDAGGVHISARFKGSPIKRAKRRGLLRNVAVALGNWGAPEAVPALAVALNDEEPLVRGHAAWALGRIGTEAARQALSGRGEVEEDAWVREGDQARIGLHKPLQVNVSFILQGVVALCHPVAERYRDVP